MFTRNHARFVPSIHTLAYADLVMGAFERLFTAPSALFHTTKCRKDRYSASGGEQWLLYHILVCHLSEHRYGQGIRLISSHDEVTFVQLGLRSS
jgi:hypothetical protein